MDDLKTLQEKRALVAASEDLSEAERSAVLKRIDARIAELQEERPKATPTKAKSKPTKAPTKAKTPVRAKTPAKAKGKEVQNMGASTKIIRRYLSMTKAQQPRQKLLNLYTDIKKALLTGAIKQSDPYAKVIMDIQKILVEALNNDFSTYELQMPQGEAMVLADAAKSERELASTVYLRQYLGLVRRPNEARAQKLKERIRLALNKGVIGSADPNYANIQRALKNLEKKRFELSEREIAGLQGLAGIEAEEAAEEANSTGLKEQSTAADIQNWNIEGMGFKGHWLELMGDPAKPFQAIVYGRPKGGKTYFNLLLANYLQGNFGRVLYISSEEYGTATLALKLKQLQIHPEITFRGDLPPNVEQYDFVFMDSANRLKIDVEAWETLKKQYPKVSFITVLQATKEGSFRGSQEWTHNCDVIVEVVSGVATAHGRYGQGQMNIFEHV